MQGMAFGQSKILMAILDRYHKFQRQSLPLFHHAPGTGQPSPETRRTGFPWEQVPLHGKTGAI